MDGHRFDELTKRWAERTTRRRVVKGVAGSVTAGLMVLAGRQRAEAGRRVSCGNVVCADDPGVCNDSCVCCVYANGNSRCMSPNRCAGDVACPDGLTSCDGACVPLGTTENCTACGDACGIDEVCGENGCECAEGLAFCDGVCTPLGTTENCTNCGDTCGVNEVCGENGCECAGSDRVDINGFCFKTPPSTAVCQAVDRNCVLVGAVEGSYYDVCIRYVRDAANNVISCSSGDCPTDVCQYGTHCIEPCEQALTS